MKRTHKILCVIAALCIICSAACFSAYAAEMLYHPSSDEEDTAPADPVPADPGYTDPAPYDPGYTESVWEDPGYTDPVVSEEPVVPTDPAEPDYGEEPQEPDPSEGGESYSPTYSDLISEGNFPQPSVSSAAPATVADNAAQYNQYIINNNNAQYDDNYIYTPEYEEPVESLISIEGRTVDTDELTGDDWESIMLGLSEDEIKNVPVDAQTFNFIKDNKEEGDVDMMWIVYLGAGLITAAVLIIIFVIVSTSKAKAKESYA